MFFYLKSVIGLFDILNRGHVVFKF